MCQHFGHCEKFAIITVKDNRIWDEEYHVPPAHQPGIYPQWLNEQGVTEIIAGGMGQKAKDIFSRHNIRVNVGVSSMPTRQTVEELIQNKLETGENLCDH